MKVNGDHSLGTLFEEELVVEGELEESQKPIHTDVSEAVLALLESVLSGVADDKRSEHVIVRKIRETRKVEETSSGKVTEYREVETRIYVESKSTLRMLDRIKDEL